MGTGIADFAETHVRRMTRRRYPHPPIVEALVDIQVAFDGSISLEEIARVGLEEEPRYPRREMVHSFTMLVDPVAGTATNATQRSVGYRYWKPGNDAVIQLRINGVLFSKLPPYENWENSLDEIKRLWQSYAKGLGPKRVTRLAVRYINRIELHAGSSDLREYFLARPDFADPLRLSVNNFLMRIESPLEGVERGMLVLTQGTVESTSPDRVAVLLDIDLFRPVDIAVADAESIWPMLEDLHERENQLFEAFITDKTRSLFA
jgi:uncharacterized protein (TIGR04255 family)